MKARGGSGKGKTGRLSTTDLAGPIDARRRKKKRMAGMTVRKGKK